MMPIDDLRAWIAIGDREYGGWKTVEVTRAFDAAASTFSLAVIDTWAEGGQQVGWPINLFDPCTVSLGGVLGLTGYVDRVEPAYNATQRGIHVAGRSKTGDLVDCSAVVPGGQFKGYKLDAIGNQLCKPFGVEVLAKADLGETFSDVSVEPGSTVFRTLDDLARSRGVVLHDDPYGRLVIDEAQESDPVAKLIEGENIFDARAALTAEERHSKIIGKSQVPGTDELWGSDASEIGDEVDDESVPRHRPLIVTPEKPLTMQALRNRLEFERAVRAGDGLVADITVLGWHVSEGKLWTPGDAVQVSSPSLYLDRTLYIKQVTHSQGQGPTSTKLQLVPLSALSKKGGGKKGGKKAGGDYDGKIWDGPPVDKNTGVA